ncbi:MAG: CaiB/BaiF CoA transferase family protein [Actinophytocola sp.]|uniref:CaiB/BaiF CoA transferase family protein n=1 Tax=Actinophytocola sp. TaxID=1872138 RepID=UPI003D6C43CE
MTHTAPLAGVTVLSLAEQYPGPYATLLLADLGADVVLVERCGAGDPSRRFPGFHEALNRNKRSVAVDLKSAAGRAVFLRMCERADVVLEGFRPGVVDRLGVGYDAVCAVNPDVVYVSISGFGQHGPLRNRPAHDVSYQAIAGMLAERLDRTDPWPAPRIAVADLSSGMFAVIAALSGLLAGSGGYFDVSMTDGLMSWMTTYAFCAANGLAEPGLPPREPGYELYRTADGGVLSLSVAHEDDFWRALCGVLGLTEHGPLSAADRRARYPELRERIASVVATRGRAEWERELDAAGVPFSPVLSVAEMVAHPHIRARELLVDVPATGGRPARRHIRQPLAIRGHATAIERHVPALGEHTREVLAAAGYPEEEIRSLLEQGVVGEP